MEQGLFDLTGKVALVTGASSGIGAGIARALAAAGASVVLVGRDEERLGSVAGEIREGGGECASAVLDLAADGAPERAIEEALRAFGALNVLVHSAGIFQPLPFHETPLESLDAQWRINVRAPFALTQAARPHLEGGGVVIFLSSITGHAAFAGSSAYNATKGAIELLSRSLAVELGPFGIRVNAIAPGWIQTAMNDHILADADYAASQIAATPLGRLGTVEDVAPAAVFLASDASRFVQGASIWVDGAFPAPPVL